jgi:hypothetical protein
MWRTPAAQAFADALTGRRPAGGEVAELVDVATRLCEIAAEAEPAPEFRTSLRTQLIAMPVAVPLVQRTHRPVRSSVGIRRWAVAFAAMLATTFGAGMTAASASTVPGDTLYPVKRAIENAQLAFKYSDASKGDFHLQLASERLGEVDQLSSTRGTSTEVVSETLAEFNRQAALGSHALMRSYLSNDSKADLVRLNRFSSASAHRLADLQGRLSAADLGQAEEVLDEMATQSVRMCPTCDGSLVDNVATQPSADIAPLDEPTAADSSARDNRIARLTGSAVPTAPASDQPNVASSATENVVPTPEVSPLSTPAPPVADLVEKSVVEPLKPLKDSALLNDLQNGALLKPPAKE